MKDTFSNRPIIHWSNAEITVGRIGHSTVVINFFGTWIITDPIFANWFGIPIPGTSWNIGIKRLHKPALRIEELPPIDILLLSHAHMDHLHPYSCEKIVKHSGGKTQVVVAPGVKRWLARGVQKQTKELDRGQVLSIDGVTIKACEVNHRGARYPRVRDRARKHKDGASYNGYLLEKNQRYVFFGGDTAYTEAMKTYAPEGIVDLAIMPIGSYDPWIHVHCNPEQALEMAHMLHAKNIVGIHWDTRGRPAKQREGDKPLRRIKKSAPTYGIEVLWEYEGEVISL